LDLALSNQIKMVSGLNTTVVETEAMKTTLASIETNDSNVGKFVE